MPHFESTRVLPGRIEEVFDFFLNPENLVRVSPPELHLRVEDAPQRLHAGARLTVRGRRWGIPRRIVSEVTAMEPPHTFTDEQREGPFVRWSHTHRFEAVEGGVRVTDEIEFEPPSGLLGLVLTENAIRRQLEWVFEYRRKKLEELFGV